jgi:hypothetical protein
MSIDDLLIAIIMAGIGFSGAYLRAEFDMHRRITAAQRRRELVQLELHTKRVRRGHNELSILAAHSSLFDSYVSAHGLEDGYGL